MRWHVAGVAEYCCRRLRSRGGFHRSSDPAAKTRRRGEGACSASCNSCPWFDLQIRTEMYVQLRQYKVFLQEHFSDSATLSRQKACSPVNSVVRRPCTTGVTEEHDDECSRALYRTSSGREMSYDASGSMLSTWITLVFMSSLPVTFTCLPRNCLALSWSSSW